MGKNKKKGTKYRAERSEKESPHGNDTHQCRGAGRKENPEAVATATGLKNLPFILFYTRLVTGKKPWSYSECQPGEEGTVGRPLR